MTKETNNLTYELFDTILELEKRWRKNQPHYSLSELYEIFPEVGDMIPEKMRELSVSLKTTQKQVYKTMTSIKYNKALDDTGKMLCQEWVKATLGVELENILKQIQTFKTLHFFTLPKPKTPIGKERITDWQIEEANKKSIDQLITDRPLRRSGNRFFCTCPFHEEKTPSFCIYPEGGGFYCYGCNEGGNAINFVMKLYNYDFIQAVRFLT